MTKSEIASVLEYIDGLFPSSDWTDDTRRLFRDRMIRLALDTDQARAVVGEYRATKRHRSPILCDLIAMMQRAVMATKIATKSAVHSSLVAGRTIRFDSERAFADYFWFAIREEGGPSRDEVVELATARYGPEVAARIDVMLQSRPTTKATA